MHVSFFIIFLALSYRSWYILFHNHSAFTDATGHRVTLSGPISHPQFIPSLTCSNPAPKPTPFASVYRNRGLCASQNCKHMSFLLTFGFYHIDCSKFCSTTTQPSLMSGSAVIHKPQQSLVKTYLGS